MLSSQIISIVTFIYLFSTVLYIGYLFFRNNTLGKVAFLTILLGFIGNTAGIGLRWLESYQMGVGHAPMSNLYESLVLFSWAIVLIYLVVELKYRARVVGAFVSPFAFLTLAFLSLSPQVSDQIEPLIPALQSNWLTSHVITCFLGYAAFAVSCGVSIMYLVKLKKDGQGITEFFPSLNILDDLNYKAIAVGFVLLSIGIITGAAWADVAWGRYWGWDPKETWSLITWFVYAAFIHARFTYGWRGKRAAILSIVGFIAVLFTYLGVNLVLSGLHSYAN
ncbi:MAG: c-type cytochrome biogenesis protein CcsB [Deltaproteobacteria bacterium]|nr:MAG: c-type cytochrome biogenesis protein CcsB [Deltaproteobacteria bacterium]